MKNKYRNQDIEGQQLRISRKNYRLAKIVLLFSIIFNIIFAFIAISNLLFITEEKPVEAILDNIDCDLQVLHIFTDSECIIHQTVTIFLDNEYDKRAINNVNFTLKFPSFCTIETLDFQSDFMNTVIPIIYEGKNENWVSMGDFSIDGNSSANLRILVKWSNTDNNSKTVKPVYSLSVIDNNIRYNIEPYVYIS
ncbi:MAG: hypothetical protein KAU84_01890 [Thermoplasmatales archaeon]|nr:hypothetical protein [Thermoplasmatales archaeon]